MNKAPPDHERPDGRVPVLFLVIVAGLLVFAASGAVATRLPPR